MSRDKERPTERVIKASKKGRLLDGGGLSLVTDEGGNRRWEFQFAAPQQDLNRDKRPRPKGSERYMGLGVLDDVPLERARELAADACKLLRAPR